MGQVSPVLSRKLEKSALVLGKIANQWVKFPIYRSSHRMCFVRKSVLRTFAKFTGKHVCQGLFFNKVAGLRNFKNGFFTEHLRATASVLQMQFLSFCRSKHPKFFPAGPFFLVLELECLLKCPNSKKTPLPSQIPG